MTRTARLLSPTRISSPSQTVSRSTARRGAADAFTMNTRLVVDSRTPIGPRPGPHVECAGAMPGDTTHVTNKESQMRMTRLRPIGRSAVVATHGRARDGTEFRRVLEGIT